jgi:hypothetical protein
VLQKIMSTTGGDVSVASSLNVDSLPQSSYPSSPPKDRDSTLTGLHQVVYRARLIGERLLVLP